MIKLSIIILTWNSQHHIGNCLYSIIRYLNNKVEPIEIIIVDNSSADNTRKILNLFKTNFPSFIKVILLNSNFGTTYSRNIAIKKSRGEYLAIIDSDVIVLDGVLDGLIQILGDNCNYGIVAPKLTYFSGKFQKSADNFPTFQNKIFRYFFLKYIENDKIDESRNIYPVDYVISAFWMVKKSTIKKVGMLDENIFYAPEDVDFCLRVWKAGLKVGYVSTIVAIHDAQEITRGFKFNRTLFEHLKGLTYFFNKHKYIFVKPKF